MPILYRRHAALMMDSAQNHVLVPVRRTRTVLSASLLAVVWNSLPTDLRVSSLTVATFARHLTIAYLFRRPC